VRVEPRGLGGIGRQEHITAAVEFKGAVAVAVQVLEQVDTAVHETRHRAVRQRPEVAVPLRALAARQRQRVARIDQDHARDAGAHRQLVRGRDAGHAGTGNDDVGSAR
jgi:hypothetical protein